MNEEIAADSGFDMDSAVANVSESLFGATEPEEDFIEETDDVVEEPTEDVVEEVEAVEETPEEPEKPKRNPPASWKKEMHEVYQSLPQEAQDYIEQREEQMRQGLEKDRGDANLGRTMRDLMTPYEAVLKSQGIDSTQAVQSLLGTHYQLSTGTPEQKQAMLQKIAQTYGIGDVKPDSQVTALQQELSQIKQHLTASHQRSLQENRTRIESEVAAFANEHPLFDDLSDEIANFIKVGYGLEEAYDKAYKLRPEYIQEQIDKRLEEERTKAEELAKKEAEEAKKAKSVNVKGRNTSKAPTEPLGTMEDTMRETFRKIKSRN